MFSRQVPVAVLVMLVAACVARSASAKTVIVVSSEHGSSEVTDWVESELSHALNGGGVVPCSRAQAVPIARSQSRTFGDSLCRDAARGGRGSIGDFRVLGVSVNKTQNGFRITVNRQASPEFRGSPAIAPVLQWIIARSWSEGGSDLARALAEQWRPSLSTESTAPVSIGDNLSLVWDTRNGSPIPREYWRPLSVSIDCGRGLLGVNADITATSVRFPWWYGDRCVVRCRFGFELGPGDIRDIDGVESPMLPVTVIIPSVLAQRRATGAVEAVVSVSVDGRPQNWLPFIPAPLHYNAVWSHRTRVFDVERVGSAVVNALLTCAPVSLSAREAKLRAMASAIGMAQLGLRVVSPTNQPSSNHDERACLSSPQEAELGFSVCRVNVDEICDQIGQLAIGRTWTADFRRHCERAIRDMQERSGLEGGTGGLWELGYQWDQYSIRRGDSAQGAVLDRVASGERIHLDDEPITQARLVAVAGGNSAMPISMQVTRYPRMSWGDLYLGVALMSTSPALAGHFVGGLRLFGFKGSGEFRTQYGTDGRPGFGGAFRPVCFYHLLPRIRLRDEDQYCRTGLDVAVGFLVHPALGVGAASAVVGTWSVDIGGRLGLRLSPEYEQVVSLRLSAGGSHWQSSSREVTSQPYLHFAIGAAL